MHIATATYITSSTSYQQDPTQGAPSYAFIGRSNVGKSSLINMVVQRKLAKTSSTPGKTKMINYFLVNDSWYLVDLPGYGWANVPKRLKVQWVKMVRAYILHTPTLRQVFVLVDIRLTPQEKDIEFINWLGRKRIPCAIVFTKIDKVNQQRYALHAQLFQDRLRMAWGALPPFFATSAVKKQGRNLLCAYITSLF